MISYWNQSKVLISLRNVSFGFSDGTSVDEFMVNTTSAKCVWDQVCLGPGVSGTRGSKPEAATGQVLCVMQWLMSATRRRPWSPDVSRGPDVNRPQTLVSKYINDIIHVIFPLVKSTFNNEVRCI